MKAGLVRLLLLLVLLTVNLSYSQSRRGNAGGSAQSSLTVTANLVPSVGLVLQPDGKQEMIVANAADAKEAFFHVPVPKRFDVNQETRVIEIVNRGKAERLPVQITTVVPQ